MYLRINEIHILFYIVMKQQNSLFNFLENVFIGFQKLDLWM